MEDKIIQVVVDSDAIYGLSESGKLYVLYENETTEGIEYTWSFCISSPSKQQE